jgi:hypothetical protein
MKLFRMCKLEFTLVVCETRIRKKKFFEKEKTIDFKVVMQINFQWST